MDHESEEAFTNWARARLRTLNLFGLVLTHDRAAAEDLVQTALVRTLVAWPRLRERGDPEGYVRRVMLNEQVSAWRREGRRQGSGPGVVMDPADSAESDVVERDRVWRALSTLPPRQRAVLVLRFYEDRSEQDVARLLRCSVGTVKSQTSKAFAKLRDGALLEPEDRQ
jgi:RNA polymerase sigma-70 factor (sigma-E family)